MTTDLWPTLEQYSWLQQNWFFLIDSHPALELEIANCLTSFMRIRLGICWLPMRTGRVHAMWTWEEVCAASLHFYSSLSAPWKCNSAPAKWRNIAWSLWPRLSSGLTPRVGYKDKSHPQPCSLLIKDLPVLGLPTMDTIWSFSWMGLQIQLTKTPICQGRADQILG